MFPRDDKKYFETNFVFWKTLNFMNDPLGLFPYHTEIAKVVYFRYLNRTVFNADLLSSNTTITANIKLQKLDFG